MRLSRRPRSPTPRPASFRLPELGAACLPATGWGLSIAEPPPIPRRPPNIPPRKPIDANIPSLGARRASRRRPAIWGSAGGTEGGRHELTCAACSPMALILTSESGLGPVQTFARSQCASRRVRSRVIRATRCHPFGQRESTTAINQGVNGLLVPIFGNLTPSISSPFIRPSPGREPPSPDCPRTSGVSTQARR